MVEICDICQSLMVAPQGSLEAVWAGRTIVVIVLVEKVGDEVVRAWWDEGVYE